MKNEFISIAIDGPAGSGKTTIAKLLAKKLGFLHLNTGSMYRAMAFYFVQNNLDFENEKIVEQNVSKINLDIQCNNGEQVDYLNGQFVTPFLRDEKVSYASSFVSQFASIRQKAVEQQKKLATKVNVVMEGRDIGTKVLPNAKYKFFLTASPEERARRRLLQIENSGGKAEYEEILKDIKQRDERDLHRAISPLVMADDAILINSDKLSIEQVLNLMLSKINL